IPTSPENPLTRGYSLVYHTPGGTACETRRTSYRILPTHALLVDTRQLPLDLALLDRLALVVELLAATQPQLDLGAVTFEVELERHEGQPLCAHAHLQANDFLAVQQQLARAHGVVVHVRALLVLGDVRAL